MGSTGWSYFVPYQRDLNAALEALKVEVFRQGLYEQPFGSNHQEFESQLDFLTSVYASLPAEIRGHTNQFLDLAQTAAKKPQPKRIPKNIKQLRKLCGENGTHAILDIEEVSSAPGFGVITPLSSQKLMDIFGTDKPTHQMVKSWSTRIDAPDVEALYARWEGVCLIIYDDSGPVEIYFEGCSGD